MSDSALPFPEGMPDAPAKTARVVQPFQFLNGSHPEVESFSEHRARKAAQNVHPSMTEDVPEDIDV